MNNIPEILSQPDSFDQSSSMWIDEAIWGHRLYDEQIPWFVLLEFLNIFYYELDKGQAFKEPNGFNTLKYKAAHRLYLRNILFNNPQITDILNKYSNDENRWDAWIKSMKRNPKGIAQPEFGYLKEHFHTFEDFYEIVTLVRSTSLEVNSNKRWTSKFVFPYGRNCLFEDLNSAATTNDRRFFGRSGELLYLMLCRASCKEELLGVLKKRLLNTDPTWDTIIECLQPSDDNDMSKDRSNAFLPYASHMCFDDLAEDWLSILRLNIPGFDIYPHLVNLVGLHLMKYQLTVAQQYLGNKNGPIFVCEMVAPKKGLVREISWNSYQSNNVLSTRTIEAFIKNIENSEEWQHALVVDDSYEKCRQILVRDVKWGKIGDYEGPPNANKLISALRQAAIKRHRQHIANIHRVYGREIGLISKRGTNRLRYAPTDTLIKTLLYTITDKRIEFSQFLEELFKRYGLIFGYKEADQVLPKEEFDVKGFQANSRRLEQRLSSLGLLKRLSDGCAYVTNPFDKEGQ